MTGTAARCRSAARRAGRPLPRAGLVGLLCLALLAGCGPSPRGSGGSGAPGAHGAAAASAPRWFGSLKLPARNVLTWNNGAEPEVVDPGLSVGQPDGNVCRMLWEGLTVDHPKTLEPLPGMAARWETSPDGLTWTFHLRPARWSDGRPVTAGDFVWSWRRVLDPRTAARNAGLLYYLKNGEAFNRGALPDPGQVGAAAPDDSTLVVTLENPTPYWIHLASHPVYMPVPRWAVERFGDRWSRPGNVVGNGPFLLTEWKPNSRFVFRKNPGYWDAANVRLDGAVMYSIDDLATSLNLYKAGVTDWNPSGNLPAQFIPYVSDCADYRNAPFLGLYYYSVNVTDPVLGNRWLRKALAWSIDREAICRDLYKGARLPRGNFTALGFAGYEAPPPIGFDPEYARQCLARAGYPGGRGLKPIEILFNTSEDHRKIAEIVQAMWRRHLGIEVSLVNQEWGSYMKACQQLQYQVARRSWIGDYADPNTFLSTMLTGSGNNRTGWSNATYDSLLDRAARTADPAARMQVLAHAEALLLDECPLIPISNYTLTELIKPWVRGVHANQTDTHFMKFAWIDRGWRAGAGSTAPGGGSPTPPGPATENKR